MGIPVQRRPAARRALPVAGAPAFPRALVDVDRQTIDEFRLEVRYAGVRPIAHK
jgi:hypothetical protein